MDLRRETTEAAGAAAEDDEMAGAPAAAGPATTVHYLPWEPLFVPREDGPAPAWLACASL